MKWNKGPSKYDGEWHVWFAWHPTYCSNTKNTVWLEDVYRHWVNDSGDIILSDWEHHEILPKHPVPVDEKIRLSDGNTAHLMMS